jgi:hypothetical protein
MILGIPVFFWNGKTEQAEKLILVTEHHGASLAMKGPVLVLKGEIEATVPVSWDAVERLRGAQFHVVGIGALRAFAKGLARCEQHDAIWSIDEALA